MTLGYFKFAAAALILLGAYLFGHSVASTKAELEFTRFKLQSEQAYSALLAEKQRQDTQYAVKIRELENEHVEAVTELRAEYDKTIANLRKSFKPSGVRKCPESGNNGAPALNSSRELVCYSASDLRARIEQSLAIGARCDKLATDYNTLLKVIEAYNAKK